WVERLAKGDGTVAGERREEMVERRLERRGRGNSLQVGGDLLEQRRRVDAGERGRHRLDEERPGRAERLALEAEPGQPGGALRDQRRAVGAEGYGPRHEEPERRRLATGPR